MTPNTMVQGQLQGNSRVPPTGGSRTVATDMSDWPQRRRALHRTALRHTALGDRLVEKARARRNHDRRLASKSLGADLLSHDLQYLELTLAAVIRMRHQVDRRDKQSRLLFMEESIRCAIRALSRGDRQASDQILASAMNPDLTLPKPSA